MLPHERAQTFKRTARIVVIPPDLTLALLHLCPPRVAPPVRTGTVPRCCTKICALVASFQMPDPARILRRPSAGHIQIPTFLPAGGSIRRAVATMWAARLEAAKKDAFLPSSRIFLHGHRPIVPQAEANHQASPRLTTRPFHVTWLPGCSVAAQ